MRAAALCSIILVAIPALGQTPGAADSSGVRPGALMGMNTLPLRQWLAAQRSPGLATGLPATPVALSTTVVSCRYSPPRAGAAPEDRHYWYDARPAWLASVPAAHPVHRLIQGAAAMCPPALSTDAALPVPTAAAAAPAVAPAPAAAAPPAPPASEGPAPNFTAKGLENEPSLTALYRGDFKKVELERESILFGSLFSAYLNAYGRACDRYLPAGKTEIMRSECAREQYQVNGYGVRVGSSICVEYRQVGTGVFADPVLYSASRELERRAAPNTLRDAFKMFTRPDAIGTALNMAGDLKVLQRDMSELVRLNGCATPALKRFETNLMAYALAKPGILATGLAPEAPAAPRTAPAGPFQDANYTRLLDDLVAEQSRTWAMNRYEAGTMSGVTVAARDNAGRPAKITGRYVFRGFNGRSQGAVTVEFTDGSPECLYFFDFPTTCRKPSRRVSTAYAEGAYR